MMYLGEDNPFTCMLNIFIQEVQHLAYAVHRDNERTPAISLNYHVFIDVSFADPNSVLSH